MDEFTFASTDGVEVFGSTVGAVRGRARARS